MSKTNHWGAWQVSEEEIRITLSPLAETICGALTKAYLVPMLRSLGLSTVGENGGKLIVWYDVSELIARPDNSGPAKDLYDRLEISGEALRRETGFSDSDAPTPEELRVMIWKKVAGSETLAPTSVSELTGAKTPAAGVAAPPAASDGGGMATPPPASTPVAGPPQTLSNPPPAPDTAPPPGMTAGALSEFLLGDPQFVTRINGNGHSAAKR